MTPGSAKDARAKLRLIFMWNKRHVFVELRKAQPEQFYAPHGKRRQPQARADVQENEQYLKGGAYGQNGAMPSVLS